MSEKYPTVEAQWVGGPLDGDVIVIPDGFPKVTVPMLEQGSTTSVAPIDYMEMATKTRIIQVTVPVGMWRGKMRVWWAGRSPRI